MNILTEFKELNIYDELVEEARDIFVYENLSDFEKYFNSMYTDFCDRHNLSEDLRSINSSKVLSNLISEVQLLR